MSQPIHAGLSTPGMSTSAAVRASSCARLRSIVLGLALAGLGSTAQAAETPPGPFWIVAGSFSNPDYTKVQTEAVQKASAAVARCGLEPFNDFSGKFIGFAEGYDVVVVGGYKTRAAAEADLKRLRPCVPTAYIRRGTYAGE